MGGYLFQKPYCTTLDVMIHILQSSLPGILSYSYTLTPQHIQSSLRRKSDPLRYTPRSFPYNLCISKPPFQELSRLRKVRTLIPRHE